MKRLRALLLHSLTATALCFAPLSCGTPSDQLTMEESTIVDHGGDTATSAVAFLTAIDQGIVHFDPTIDPMADAPTNAQAVGTYAQGQFGNCASVGVMGATVSITIAGPSCTLPNGTIVSGSMTASLSKVGSTTTVEVTFTNGIVDEHMVSGMLSLATQNGTTFTANGTIISAGNSLTFNGLQVIGSAGAFTLDGTLTAVKDGVTSTVTLTRVGYRMGDCYPYTGTARIVRGMITTTMTFNPSTASSGLVTVSAGRVTTSKQLPAYGSCPGTHAGPDAGLRRDR